MTSPFKVGDRVVLTRGGCNQPAFELMAIWTVKGFLYAQVKVEIDPSIQTVQGLDRIGERRYPPDWLVLYRRRSPRLKPDIQTFLGQDKDNELVTMSG